MSNRRRRSTADVEVHRSISRRWERRAKAKERKLADARHTISALTEQLDAIADQLDNLTTRLNRQEPR